MKEIISKNIISCDINSSVSDVSKLMKKYNIGFIPIKDNNEYVGIITDRDIALIIPNLKSINDSIKPYITNNIISISINEVIDDALELMSKEKIKRLLVKEKDSIIGVLSISDILNYNCNNKVLDTYKSIFEIKDNTKERLSKIDDIRN